MNETFTRFCRRLSGLVAFACLITLVATASGCLSKGPATPTSSPQASAESTVQSSAQSTSPADAAEADADALDIAMGTDGDVVMNGVDARAAKGPSEIVSGVIVDESEVVSVEMLVEWIDTGDGKPVSVVLNRFTKLSWPASWGRYHADPNADVPAVKLPAKAPDSVIGRNATARVRVIRVPGITRLQAYAIDFEFLGK